MCVVSVGFDEKGARDCDVDMQVGFRDGYWSFVCGPRRGWVVFWKELGLSEVLPFVCVLAECLLYCTVYPFSNPVVI